tara:strand:- start:11632 stop:11832 length:201 start_codon:yes stop_codon:yes gene_type:complete
MVLIWLLIFGVGGWFLFTGIFDLIFGKSEKKNYKPDKHIHYHYNTHNHLHVDKKDLTEMISSKKKI